MINPQLQHQSIYTAIDTILSKGSQKLYNSYIKQKLPNHASQISNSILEGCMGIAYNDAKQGGKIQKQFNIPRKLVQTNLPNKINTQKRRIMQQKISLNDLSKNNSKQKFINNSSIISERRMQKLASKARQKLQINLQALKNPQEQTENYSQVRKQHDYRFCQSQRQRLLHQQQKSNKQTKQRLMKAELAELQINGIPYHYDNEGNFAYPDKKQYKIIQYQNAKAEKRRQNKIIKLSNTIDFTNHQHFYHNEKINGYERYVKEGRKIIGKKKGYFSSQFYKKLKMTNQQYNNQSNRQNSTIPYLVLAQGIRVTQRFRNVTAQKHRNHSLQLSQYKQKNQTNFFKSFVPQYDSSQLMMQTMSVSGDRPYTTAKFNRTKKTSQTGVSERMMKTSILWRPRTSDQKQKIGKFSRMRIENQDLARGIIRPGS